MRQLSLIEKNPALAGVIKLLASVAAECGPDERAGIYASQFFQFQYPAALAQDLRTLFDQYVAEHVPLVSACEALAHATSEQTRLFLLLKLGEFTTALDRFDERFCEHVAEGLRISREDLQAIVSLCSVTNTVQQTVLSPMVGQFEIGPGCSPVHAPVQGLEAQCEVIKLGPDLHVRTRGKELSLAGHVQNLPPDFLIRVDYCDTLLAAGSRITHNDLSFLWRYVSAPTKPADIGLHVENEALVVRPAGSRDSAGMMVSFQCGSLVFSSLSHSRVLVNKRPIEDGGRAGLLDKVHVQERILDVKALIAELSSGEEPDQVVSFGAKALRHRLGKVTLIDEVSFCSYRHELTAIMGLSGSGKSTLLNSLRGEPSPESGELQINGIPIRNPDRITHLIGFVPQDDLLHETFTVEENLIFSARLRFPRKSRAEIKTLVDGVLEKIGLSARRNALVGNALRKGISGGERKRLNIGLELLSENPILFLDEPTSGLSSEDSESIIRLLRARCDEGALILVVIHQPSPEVLVMFDKLLLLDQGGRQVYFGDPPGAFRYLESALQLPSPISEGQLPDPDRLLEMIDTRLKNLDGAPLAARRFRPDFWKERFRVERRRILPLPIIHSGKLPTEAIQRSPAIPLVSKAWQGVTLVHRELLKRLRDRATILSACGIALALGLTIGVILRDSSATGTYTLSNNWAFAGYPFLTVIVGIFLGLSISINEIIRDRAVLKREKALLVSPSLYLAAKFFVTAFYLIPLVAIYLLTTFWLLEVRELYLGYLLYLWLTGLTGVSLGLLVSACPGINEKTATALLPILLVPQIILAGSEVLPFRRMAHLRLGSALRAAGRGDFPPQIADFIPARWSYEGLIVMHRLRSRSTEIEKLAAEKQRLGVVLRKMKEEGVPESSLAYIQTARTVEKTIQLLGARTNALQSYTTLLPTLLESEPQKESPVKLFSRERFFPWSSGKVETHLFNALALLPFIILPLIVARILIGVDSYRLQRTLALFRVR